VLPEFPARVAHAGSYCGADFQNDTYFVQSAVEEAKRLKEVLGLEGNEEIPSSVLLRAIDILVEDLRQPDRQDHLVP
jgi:hypothetical protein